MLFIHRLLVTHTHTPMLLFSYALSLHLIHMGDKRTKNISLVCVLITALESFISLLLGYGMVTTKATAFDISGLFATFCIPKCTDQMDSVSVTDMEVSMPSFLFLVC